MDQHSPSAPAPSQHGAPGPRRGRRFLILTTLMLAAALSGAIASRAVSQHAYGPHMLWGPFDPARVEDRADRMTRHVAIEIDATNEQQEKLRAIVKSAVKDLLPLREKALINRQRAQSLLTQPSIDRAAIEALRSEQMALADTASRRLAQAIGDAAEVLNPEQRRKLSDRLTELREHRGFWHGWRHG
jgi:periplasmic protein CpxP/Spy